MRPLDPDSRAAGVVEYLDRIDSTVQYSWLLEIARTFHRFPHDRITPANLGELLSRADHRQSGPEWDHSVWAASGLETVFLTNEFDDPLEGWDTRRYVPCLRVDDLVLKLHEPQTTARLRKAVNMEVDDFIGLRRAIGLLFERFVGRGARAVAVSLPPDFVPRAASHQRARTPIRKAIHGMDLRGDEREEARNSVFWLIAEFCGRLPSSVRPDDWPDPQCLSRRCRGWPRPL